MIRQVFQWDATVWAAVIAAIAACVAAWYSYRSSDIARKSFYLQQQQEKRRNPHIDIYLDNAHIRRFKHEQHRIYAFYITITNKSEADNSIRELTLTITYNHGQEPNSTIVVPHNYRLTKGLPYDDAGVFRVPTAIGAYQSLAGWALFDISDELLRGTIIHSYNMTIVDSHGTKSTYKPIILRELEYEDSMAQGPD